MNFLTILAVGASEVAFAFGGAVGALICIKLFGARAIGGARQQADQIIRDARQEAQTLGKQLELDGRNELAQRREEFEKELYQARNELRENERRVTKREDNLDRKLDVLTTKEKYLDDQDNQLKGRERSIAAKDAELDQSIVQYKGLIATNTEEQKREMMRISRLTEDDARKESLQIVEHEVQHEAAQIIQREMDIAHEECRENAQKITLQAIQRYASEHTADSTVSSVPIANDEMKGRVIGREGRNIRAFEKATGVDVIVDDTPGVVVVSCFDPVRRAIASESLSKLLEDGRIHPTRIEEVVEQTGKDMQLYYRMSYGQNILRHSVEVAFLCQVIADELGLDGALARRCGFLHDIGKAMDHDVEGGHPAIGMDFCKKFGEKDIVLNAIGGHHNDIPSISPYTPIVMSADAISGARPGARRETLEKYVRRLQQLEEIANAMKGVKSAFAIQAGREVRVIVDPDHVDDTNCTYIARDIAKRVSEEMTFPGEIRVTVLRELRTVDYAR
jgi:ribonuclease Y